MRPGHDQVWLEEIKQHLPETWFAWMGGFGGNGVFIRLDFGHFSRNQIPGKMAAR
jgi:hypothetical protein